MISRARSTAEPRHTPRPRNANRAFEKVEQDSRAYEQFEKGLLSDVEPTLPQTDRGTDDLTEDHGAPQFTAVFQIVTDRTRPK